MEHAPTSPTAAGLPRRTILTGAAWSVPAIAIATITPAASASGTLELAFDKTSYTGTGCSTITGASVTATTDNTPTAGASITVTLSNGYTFANGATTATGITGSDGRYALPAINVPVAGGTATLTATSSTATATASVTGTAAAAGVFNHSSAGNDTTKWTTGSPQGVPATARPVGWDTWLTPAGDLYRGVTKIATNVTAAVAYATPDGRGVFTSYQTSSGVFNHASPGNDTTKWTTTNITALGVPANARPVGWDTWLTPTGDLYRGVTKIATNVTAAVAYATPDGRGVFTSYQTSSGVFDHSSPGNDTTKWTSTNITALGVPATATPVGWDTWLTPTGDLYRGVTKIATNVTAAVAYVAPDGSGVWVSYQTPSGVFNHSSPGNDTTKWTTGSPQGVPATARPVGWDTWLTPTGDLYRGVTKIATNVIAAVAYATPNNTGVWASYQTRRTSC